MIKIIKEMKPFTIIIFLIIGLLFFQAATDLALPDYMSNIVNVGIQQNGIENAVPEVIRASELEKVRVFLSDEENNLVDNSFKSISKDNLTQEEYNDYSNKYPALIN